MRDRAKKAQFHPRANMDALIDLLAQKYPAAWILGCAESNEIFLNDDTTELKIEARPFGKFSYTAWTNQTKVLETTFWNLSELLTFLR